MTVSATIPVEHMDAANAELEELGHGSRNFSIMLHPGNAPATHAGLHAWDDPGFLQAVQSLSYPGLVIRHEAGRRVNFWDHLNDRALQRMTDGGVA